MAIKIKESPDLAKTPRRIRAGDIVVIVALLAGTVAFITILHSHPSDRVKVFRNEEVIAEYPLDEDRIFSMEGLIGSVVVEIKDKQVRVVSSSCPNKICVHTGWISRSDDQFIFCAPNRILVITESGSEKERRDAVNR